MNPTAGQESITEVRDLLADLRRSDQETDGQPQLPPERISFAREWLSRLLVDARLRIQHIELLQELYGAKFRWPEPRGVRPGFEEMPVVPPVGFRHNQLLPEEKSRGVLERGPAVLTDEELARLLLNPLALWDVADLLIVRDPDYWSGSKEELGRQLEAEYASSTKGNAGR